MLFITGFEGFQGVEENPTSKLLMILREDDCIAKGRIAPVSISGVDAILEDCELCTENESYSDQNTFWIHFGVDQNAKRIRLEAAAYNECSFRIPDADGVLFDEKQIDDSKPLTHTICTSLNVFAIQRSILESTGIKFDISTDPGRYLCNYLYYKSLSRHQNAIFVHVPPFEVMDLQTQIVAIRHLFNIIYSTKIESEQLPGELYSVFCEKFLFAEIAVRCAYLARNKSSNFREILDFLIETDLIDYIERDITNPIELWVLVHSLQRKAHSDGGSSSTPLTN